MATQQQHPFIIAISGCTSAGKGTLAFLLSEIFTGGEFVVPSGLRQRACFALDTLSRGGDEQSRLLSTIPSLQIFCIIPI